MVSVQAIHTDGLTKYYGETRGIEDLDLAVESGEIFGFLGPNGAGKTTTIRTLLGFMEPTAGAATVLGKDVTDESELLTAKRDMGFLPGDPAFDDGVTGQRYLDLHASLKGDERREELLEIFDPPLDRKIGEYSRGNRQMLGLVQAFMHDPELVVMDEPTSGLDPLKQEQFNDFVDAETERGTTVFFSSHVLSEVRKVCDRVGIIRDGHLVEVAEVGDLLDRSGRLVTVTLDSAPGPNAFDLHGVHDRVVDGSRVRFTYTGSYDAFVDALDRHSIVDLEIQEAPLEEIFMRFYDDGRTTDDSARQTHSTADERGGSDDV